MSDKKKTMIKNKKLSFVVTFDLKYKHEKDLPGLERDIINRLLEGFSGYAGSDYDLTKESVYRSGYKAETILKRIER